MLMLVIMAPRLPLIFLLMIHGVSSADWGVSYSHSHICALKNSSVIMSCTYTYPTEHQIRKVFWTKNPVEGVEPPDLSEDPEYSQRLQYLGDTQQNCTIRLSHVTQKDEHEYCFRFTTDKPGGKWLGKPGVSLTVTDLQVESPERVTEGDSVRLTCKSSCTLTDRATFIWYRNSQPLTERRDTNNQLLLQSVRREDAGRYSCALHGHTYISPDVHLNVMYPPVNPVISISPSGEIVEGDSVTLNCSSDSNPPAEINWFKGGTFVGSGGIYNISKISSDHSGEYKCKSRNQHGEKYSDAVTLDIMYPPRKVSVSISPSGEIAEGDSVTLNCSSDSNPPANISWFKGGTFVGSERIYNISKISSDHSGEYKCKSINKHGEKYCDAVTLDIISDSNPPAEISWFKGGTSVGSGRIYSISKISSDHSGEYKCKSINKHGEKDSDAVILNIMYPPRKVSVFINGSAEIVEGDSVTLICSSDSNPPALNFSWFKEDESSSVGSGQSFSALQSGRFYCEAHNQHGSQRSDAVTVTVHHGAGMNVIVITAASGGGLFIIIIIIIIIILFKMRKRRNVKTEDLTMKPNDLYSLVSPRVSVHGEPLSEDDAVNDALYANVKPSRSRGKTPESRDTEEIQDRPEDNECPYEDIRVYQPDAAMRRNQRNVKTEDLTMKPNDLHSVVSPRVSVHDEPLSEDDAVNDALYANVKPSRSRGKTLESTDTEEIQYATVQYQRKKEDLNLPEDNECQYEDIRVHQPDAAMRPSNVQPVEDASVIYSSVK
ncbi:B-cell receptor CD22-like [Garra rufa]|uniref:B-cell receptor CD22-like n=1 Tax=Garra rufa TaxID=137080 RepID=UPI003CCEE1DE